MKKISVIFRRAPHGSASAREGLDFALLSASFEQEVSLFFVDEGVFNLVGQQVPELIGAKDFIATFKALPLYDIEQVYVCRQSLADFNLSEATLNIAVEPLTHTEIAARLDTTDEVFVY